MLFHRVPYFSKLQERALRAEVIKPTLFRLSYVAGKEIHVVQDFILWCYYIQTPTDNMHWTQTVYTQALAQQQYYNT